MDILAGIGIHEARLAFHVAAIRQIENHERPGPVLYAHYSVIVYWLLRPIFTLWGDRECFHPFVKNCIGREQVLEFSMPVTALLHENLPT